jgi:hypothetical protein
VLSGRVLCVGLITRVESPTGCGVSEYNREASLSGPGPLGAVAPREKRNMRIRIYFACSQASAAK